MRGNMSSHAENLAGEAVGSLEVIPWFNEAFHRLDRNERREIRIEMVDRFGKYLNDHVYNDGD